MEAIASQTGRIPKTTSSVHDVSEERPPWGSRFLTEQADVWSHNAWDHVPPPDDQADIIAASLARQHLSPVPDEDKQKYNDKPAKHWDNFYKNNAGNFFRNRKWLHLEFPDLVAAAELNAGPQTIVEVGCGAGNAVLPLLASNQNPELRFHAYDYASHAVKVVQNDPLYTAPPCGSISASVWDLSSPDIPDDLEAGTADMLILVFVLSALHPREWAQALSNIHKMLKPGGLVLFRDYGRHDLTQLRFKGGRLLEDNFYIRGDKTRVYFFELDELAMMFTGRPATATQRIVQTTEVTEEDDTGPSTPFAGDVPHTAIAVQPVDLQSKTTDTAPAIPVQLPEAAAAGLAALPHPLFAADQLGIDRRLLVNRKRQLKMYRIWMQAKFRKLPA